MNFLQRFTQILFLLPLAGLLMACGQPDPKTSHNTQTVAGKTNTDTPDQKLKTAPDFTLQTMEGDSFTLSNQKGKIVVLNFWATWCAPCRKEIPDFMELHKELKDQGVLFAGVSLDEEGWQKVRPYAQKMEINYPIMVDNRNVSRQYGPIRAIPTTFIINKKGQVEYVAPGMLNKSRLKPILTEMANR